MKVYLDGHDFEFAVQQIYMCMFPNSHAEFTAAYDENADFIKSSLSYSEDMAFSETLIRIDGKASVGKAGFSFDEITDEEEIKRIKKRAVKTSFYRASLAFLPKAPVWGALTGVRPSKVAAKYINSGKNVAETARLMQEDYFVSPDRALLAAKCAARAEKMAENTARRDMSLYAGIPFCASRCRYCSFVSHSIEKAKHLVLPYLSMLKKEIEGASDACRRAGLNLRSVYVGGGTPTALSNEELAFVLRCISDNFNIKNIDEYTVEGGRPDTLSIEKIRTIAASGATRISVNPQTMNDEILRQMDRRHTAADVVRAISDVRRVGGLAINTDLIAGLPNDSFESFKNSVDSLICLHPENITVHTLAVKKGSDLHRENYILPDGDETARMVEYAMNALGDAGYNPYYLYRQKYMSGNLENVGYSLPGYESDYNNYIMDELHTIVSVGAGGVTKLIDRENARVERMFNPKYPYEYNNADEKLAATRQKIIDFFSGEEVHESGT